MSRTMPPLDPPKGLKGPELFRALADRQRAWIEYCEANGSYEQTESKTLRGICAQEIREADEAALWHFIQKGKFRR